MYDIYMRRKQEVTPAIEESRDSNEETSSSTYNYDRTIEVREAGKIYSPEDLKLFWSDIIRDEEVPLKQRMEASNLLGKTYSMFSENVNVKHGLEDELQKLSIEAIRMRLSMLMDKQELLPYMEAEVIESGEELRGEDALLRILNEEE